MLLRGEQMNKKSLVFLLLIGIMIAIGVDLFLIFNNKSNINQNNNDPNNSFTPTPNIEH